jgi:hypothetical protein
MNNERRAIKTRLYNPDKYFDEAIKKELIFLGLGETNLLFRKKVYLELKRLKQTLSIQGPSGYGKTELIKSIVYQICPHVPVFILDGKGDFGFARDLSNICDKNQFELAVFDTKGNDSNPTKSIGYNPFVFKDHGQHQADLLMKAFSLNSPGHDSQFYHNVLARFLTLLSSCFNRIDYCPTIADIYYFLTDFRMQQHILGLFSEHEESRKEIGVLIEMLGPRSIGKLENLISILGKFVMDKHINDILSERNWVVSIEKAFEQKGVTLFSLSKADRQFVNIAIAKFVLADIEAYVSRRQSRPESENPFAILILDECNSFIDDNFAEFLITCRSANIGVILTFQSEALLPEKVANVLFDSAYSRINFRVNSNAERYAEPFGTRTSFNESKQYEGNNLFMGAQPTGTSTRTDAERFVMPPNAFRTLECGECILKSDNPNGDILTTPFMDKKYKLFFDEPVMESQRNLISIPLLDRKEILADKPKGRKIF